MDADRRRKQIREVFAKRDMSGDGELQIHELPLALQDLGVSVEGGVKGIKELLQKIDSDGNGSVSLEEFETLFDVARLQRIFEEIDEDKSGTISEMEMRAALKKMGVSVSAGDAKRMLRSVDTSGDGVISWDEFLKAFQNVPLASLESIANRWANMGGLDTGSDLSPPLPNAGIYMWQTVIAGGMAGVCSRTATAPLERMKLAAQTRGLSSVAAMQEFRSVLRREGARGLFTGNLTNCLRVFPTGAITCTIYFQLLALTPADNDVDSMEPVWRLSCAATAAAIANSITYPMDVVRTRLTLPDAGGPKYTGIASAFSSIIKNEGLATLWKGLRPTLYAVVPFVAVQQTSIDMLKNIAGERGIEPTPPVLLCVGGMAGIAAQSVVYPLDVLRRRMQLGPEATGSIVADRTWLALRTVVQKEGFRSLFSGIVPTFAKTIPAVGVAATVCVSTVNHFKAANKRAMNA